MSKPICTIPGCSKPVYVKKHGLCSVHYKRKWRGLPMHRPTPEQRFFEKVSESPSGCWEWQARISEGGYGQFSLVTDRPVPAHRWAYEHIVGEIPNGLQLDHLCRNRACVNPWHLEPVRAAVNTLRGEGQAAVNSRKSECLRGHPFDSLNTYVTPNGRRQCRACGRMRSATQAN